MFVSRFSPWVVFSSNFQLQTSGSISYSILTTYSINNLIAVDWDTVIFHEQSVAFQFSVELRWSIEPIIDKCKQYFYNFVHHTLSGEHSCINCLSSMRILLPRTSTRENNLTIFTLFLSWHCAMCKSVNCHTMSWTWGKPASPRVKLLYRIGSVWSDLVLVKTLT